MEALFIGLDIGTSKVCAVALDASGRDSSVASRANEADVDNLPEGRHEQDPGAIWRACLEVLRELCSALGQRAKAVRAIGLTGQMHGGLLVDANRAPLTNLVTWRDGRGGEQVAGRTVLDVFRDRVGRDDLASSGSRPASGHLGVTLLHYLMTESLPEDAHRALCIHDWVAARLAGAEPVTDASDAASTGLMDVRRGGWDMQVLEALGLPPELLPTIRPPGEALGKLAAEVADATGLPATATVHVPLGDNQASVLAAVGDAEADLVLNIGTGGQVSCVTDAWLEHPNLEMRPFPGGRRLAVGASLCGGAAFRYLAEHYRRIARLLTGRDVPMDDILTALVREAAAVPETELRADVRFRGTRSQPDLTGSITVMTPQNNTPGHHARAYLVGIVEELAGYYAAMRECGVGERTRCVGTGNGLRRNPVLREAAERILAMPLVTPVWTEEAACGAALSAMVGCGAWDSFDAAGGISRRSRS